MSPTSLQGEIDALQNGGVLELSPREFAGPIYIRRSITIDGNGATFWGLKGPVLIIEGSGRVVLKNLRVEVTCESESSSSADDCAIRIDGQVDVDLEEVEVRGSVEGLQFETSNWRVPKTVHLGQLTPNADQEFRIRLLTGAPCVISSAINGISIEPSKVNSGPSEFRMKLEELRNDTMLYGKIVLRSPFVRRSFVVCAHVLAGPDAQPCKTGVDAPLIWEPTDWAEQSSASPAAAPRPPRHEEERRPTPSSPAVPPTPTITIDLTPTISINPNPSAESSTAEVPPVVPKSLAPVPPSSIPTPTLPTIPTSPSRVPVSNHATTPPITQQPSPPGGLKKQDISKLEHGLFGQKPTSDPLTKGESVANSNAVSRPESVGQPPAANSASDRDNATVPEKQPPPFRKPKSSQISALFTSSPAKVDPRQPNSAADLTAFPSAAPLSPSTVARGDKDPSSALTSAPHPSVVPSPYPQISNEHSEPRPAPKLFSRARAVSSLFQSAPPTVVPPTALPSSPAPVANSASDAEPSPSTCAPSPSPGGTESTTESAAASIPERPTQVQVKSRSASSLFKSDSESTETTTG